MRRKMIAALVGAILAMSAYAAGSQQQGKPASGDSEQKPYTMEMIIRGTETEHPAGMTTHMNEVWTKKAGLSIAFQFIGKNVFEEKINVVIASGQYPDLLYSPRVDILGQGIESGAIIPITPYVKSDPVWSKVDPANFEPFTHNGEIYAFPDKANLPETIYYRADWAKKLKLDPPRNPDQLYAFLAAFVKDKPNTYAFSLTGGDRMNGQEAYWRQFVYTTPNGIGLYLDKASETIKSQLALTKDLKDAYAWMRRAYNDKLLDPEFVVDKAGDVENKFVTGRTAAWVKGVHWVLPRHVKMAERDANVEILSVPGFKGRYGNIYQATAVANDAWYMMKKTPEWARARVAAFNAFYCGPEGKKIRTFGVPGVHYKIENGKFAWLDKTAEASFNPGQYVASVLKVEFPFPIPVLEKNIESMNKFDYADNLTSVIAQSPLYAEKAADFGKLAQETTVRIIIGDLGPEAVDAMYAEAKKLGLDEVLAEINAVYAKVRK